MGLISFFAILLKDIPIFVAYVKNNAFPQPLSSEEEMDYLKKFEEGDLEARNKLIEHNLRLVAHIVKKFENTSEDTEDLISIGTIGLIKAIESFSIGKGTKSEPFTCFTVLSFNNIFSSLSSSRNLFYFHINKSFRLFP